MYEIGVADGTRTRFLRDHNPVCRPLLLQLHLLGFRPSSPSPIRTWTKSFKDSGAAVTPRGNGVADGDRTRYYLDHNQALIQFSFSHHVYSLRGQESNLRGPDSESRWDASNPPRNVTS